MQYGYGPAQPIERSGDYRHATTSHGRLSSDGSDASAAAIDGRPASRKAGHGLVGAFPGGVPLDGRTSTPLMQQERLLGRAKIAPLDERLESGQDEQVSRPPLRYIPSFQVKDVSGKTGETAMGYLRRSSPTACSVLSFSLLRRFAPKQTSGRLISIVWKGQKPMLNQASRHAVVFLP